MDKSIATKKNIAMPVILNVPIRTSNLNSDSNSYTYLIWKQIESYRDYKIPLQMIPIISVCGLVL